MALDAAASLYCPHPHVVKGGIANNLRLDGRSLEEYRPIEYRIHGNGQVELSFGTSSSSTTKVLAQVIGEKFIPSRDRANQGKLSFQCEFQSGIDGTFVENSTRKGTVLAQKIQKIVKGTHAIDEESLCITAGKEAWHLQISVKILMDEGNAADAAILGTLMALSTFEKNDEKEGEELAAPMAALLAVHHLPISTTFYFFDDEKHITDATAHEEKLSNGSLQIAINQYGDCCLIEGSGLQFGTLIASGTSAIHEVFYPLARARTEEVVKGFQRVLSEYQTERNLIHTKRGGTERAVYTYVTP